MSGLTSHYCGCLRGYVWSYFSLLWVFERVCVVILLTTVGVYQGMCGLTSHYCGCLRGYVWSHFSLQWLFDVLTVCLPLAWFILSLAGASVQCMATYISLVQYLSQATCSNQTMSIAVRHNSLECQHSSQLPTGDSAILVCRAPGKPWYCRTLVRPGWGLCAT